MTRNNIVLLRTVFTKCITLFCFAVVVRRSELGGGYVPGAGGVARRPGSAGRAPRRIPGAARQVHSRLTDPVPPASPPAHRRRARVGAHISQPVRVSARISRRSCRFSGRFFHFLPLVGRVQRPVSLDGVAWSADCGGFVVHTTRLRLSSATFRCRCHVREPITGKK